MSVVAGRLILDENFTEPDARDGSTTLRLETRIVSGPEWDRTIAGFDEVCQEQMHAFASVRWPQVRQEPVVFLHAGRVVGGSMMMLQALPLGVGHIAVAKWGPMLADAGRADAAEIHAGMIDALTADYVERRGHMLSVLPRASIDEVNHDYDRLAARGFQRGTQLLFPNRYIVNVRLDDAAQRKSFHQKWRYHLNKSEKAGLSFEHARPDDIGAFQALYDAMTDRKQFPDHSAYETMPALMAIENETLRPELFFVRHEGELVAGALIFKAGDRAVYLYGATNDRALPLRAGYFMHWHIIRWLRDNTPARWYDLGGTDGFQGLHQFKKGMVGEAGVIRPVPPVANYARGRLTYLLGTGAFAARDAIASLRRAVAGWRNPKARPDQSRHETVEVAS